VYTSSTDISNDGRSGYGIEPRSGTGELLSCVNTEAKCIFLLYPHHTVAWIYHNCLYGEI